MHTLSAGKLRVHFNSDWSGEAIIQQEGKEPLSVSAVDFAALATKVTERFLEQWLEELQEAKR